jgi:cytochrome d ubiquinol oxidase subunit II
LWIPKQNDRKTLQTAIGPLWNGNEVWLITAGGALFAAFPAVYATFCSAFYLPVIALLMSFIVRAISLEVRGSVSMAWWRGWWDLMFSIGSVAIAAIFGVALGNLMQGISLDESQEFSGRLRDLINPYAILIGAMSVVLFVLHGSLYSLVKTENRLHEVISKHIPRILISFVSVYLLTLACTLIYQPHLIAHIMQRPLFWIVSGINIVSIGTIFWAVATKRESFAFGASCVTVCSLMMMYALATFPVLVRSLHHPDQLSLTVFNAASSPLSLKILFTYIGIGIPCVVAYSSYVYWVFRGKVRGSGY